MLGKYMRCYLSLTITKSKLKCKSPKIGKIKIMFSQTSWTSILFILKWQKYRPVLKSFPHYLCCLLESPIYLPSRKCRNWGKQLLTLWAESTTFNTFSWVLFQWAYVSLYLLLHPWKRLPSMSYFYHYTIYIYHILLITYVLLNITY